MCSSACPRLCTRARVPWLAREALVETSVSGSVPSTRPTRGYASPGHVPARIVVPDSSGPAPSRQHVMRNAHRYPATTSTAALRDASDGPRRATGDAWQARGRRHVSVLEMRRGHGNQAAAKPVPCGERHRMLFGEFYPNSSEGRRPTFPFPPPHSPPDQQRGERTDGPLDRRIARGATRGEALRSKEAREDSRRPPRVHRRR